MEDVESIIFWHDQMSPGKVLFSLNSRGEYLPKDELRGKVQGLWSVNKVYCRLFMVLMVSYSTVKGWKFPAKFAVPRIIGSKPREEC